MALKPLALVLALGMSALTSLAVRAAESVVLSAAAMRLALAERPPEGFKPGDSDKPTTFGTAGEMFNAAVSGAPFDVIILPPARLEDLARRGIINAASIHPLGTMHLALAVRHGVQAPDISSEATFRDALANASSVAIADPAQGATTGLYLKQLFERLGLADTLRPKLRLYADGQAAMEALAHGDVAIAIGQASEAAPVRGIDVVPNFPASLQLKTVYAAAIAAHPVDRSMAERTMTRLSAPSFQAILRQQGFTPAQ